MQQRSPMHEYIIDVAEALFYQHGTQVVGVDRVIAAADIAKATLYRHFPSKRLLIEAYLRRRHRQLVAGMTERIVEANLSAAQRIERAFDELATKAARSDFRGCAFLVAVAENEGAAGILDIAVQHKTWVRKMFATLASELGATSEAEGEELALLYEGALASIAVGRTPAPALVAKRAAQRLIEALTNRTVQ